MARKTGSHSEITGPKIKQTALELFARYGFAAVSMRKIASEVGVQAGAIYNYTPDKQGLLFDLLYGHMEDLLTSWHLQNVSQDPIAALDHFVGFHLDFHICRPDLVFISYMELRNLNPNNFMIIEDEVKHLPNNTWWLTDTTHNHTALNGSTKDRIHLVAVLLGKRLG